MPPKQPSLKSLMETEEKKKRAVMEESDARAAKREALNQKCTSSKKDWEKRRERKSAEAKTKSSTSPDDGPDSPDEGPDSDCEEHWLHNEMKDLDTECGPGGTVTWRPKCDKYHEYHLKKKCEAQPKDQRDGECQDYFDEEGKEEKNKNENEKPEDTGGADKPEQRTPMGVCGLKGERERQETVVPDEATAQRRLEEEQKRVEGSLPDMRYDTLFPVALYGDEGKDMVTDASYQASRLFWRLKDNEAAIMAASGEQNDKPDIEKFGGVGMELEWLYQKRGVRRFFKKTKTWKVILVLVLTLIITLLIYEVLPIRWHLALTSNYFVYVIMAILKPDSEFLMKMDEVYKLFRQLRLDDSLYTSAPLAFILPLRYLHWFMAVSVACVLPLLCGKLVHGVFARWSIMTSLKKAFSRARSYLLSLDFARRNIRFLIPSAGAMTQNTFYLLYFASAVLFPFLAEKGMSHYFPFARDWLFDGIATTTLLKLWVISAVGGYVMLQVRLYRKQVVVTGGQQDDDLRAQIASARTADDVTISHSVSVFTVAAIYLILRYTFAKFANPEHMALLRRLPDFRTGLSLSQTKSGQPNLK